jgi:hypothetical protein
MGSEYVIQLKKISHQSYERQKIYQNDEKDRPYRGFEGSGQVPADFQAKKICFFHSGLISVQG